MSFNTTGTQVVSQALSHSSQLSSMRLSGVDPTATNLGYGVGRMLYNIAHLISQGWEKVSHREPSPAELTQQRQYQRFCKGVDESVRQLNLAIDTLRKNPKNAGALQKVESLAKDYGEFLAVPQDNLQAAQNKLLKPLIDKIEAIVHPVVKAQLSQIPALSRFVKTDTAVVKRGLQQTNGFPAIFNLSALDGTNGFVIIGPGDGLGWSVSTAGDINGDGIKDIVIGAPDAAPGGSTNAGVAYILFGQRGGWSSAINLMLTPLTGNNGFVANGLVSGDQLGYSVSSAGDMNGDSIDDIVLGAYNSSAGGPIQSGAGYVVLGKSTGWTSPFNLATLNGASGFVAYGRATQDILGDAVSAIGDINHDGVVDVAFGATQSSIGALNAGYVYVVFGSYTGWSSPFSLSTLNGNNGFAISGATAYGYDLGNSISTAGDINNDGIVDFIVGADGNSNPSSTAPFMGAAYVIFGKASGWTPLFNLTTLNGANGFAVYGLGANNYLGDCVRSVGDVNADGITDFAVGASGASNPSGPVTTGAVYVIFGKSTGWTSPFDLTTLNGNNGFVAYGLTTASKLFSVDAAGDVNGDGIADLVLGAYEAPPGGGAYVIFGKKSGWVSPFDLSSLNGVNGFSMHGESVLGFSVSAAGDVNGDRIGDLLVGDYGRSKAYVIFGKNTSMVSPPPTFPGSGSTMSSLSPMSSIIPTPPSLSNISSPMGPSSLCSSFDSDCQTLTWGLTGSVVGVIALAIGLYQLKKNIDDKKTRAKHHDLPRYLRRSLINDYKITISKIDNFESDKGDEFVTFFNKTIQPAILKFKKVGDPEHLREREIDSITQLVAKAIAKEVDQGNITSQSGCCGKRVVDLADIINEKDKIIARVKSSVKPADAVEVKVSDQDDDKGHPLIEKPSSKKSKNNQNLV